MRRVTRNLLLGILAVVVLLLALGALPSYLKAGDPYYLTATPDGADVAVDVTNLTDRQYPYASAALANASADTPGRSGPYWRGPVGVKGAFTHSPFDEVEALGNRNPNATDGGDVFVRRNGTTYRLAIVQEAPS